MRVEKYDWRSKMREALGCEEPVAKNNKSIDQFPATGPQKHNWRFKKAIADAVELVEAEEKAQREREAAEKAQLEKARQKAMMVRDQVILPLLNGLRDNFAVHERRILPEWQIESHDAADTFSVEAITPNIGSAVATRFTIRAEAAVAELGEYVNLAVVCSSVSSRDASADQTASLVEKTAKFPTIQKFDELSSRNWFHKQLAASARMCILTKMRQYPTIDVAPAAPVLVGV
jgi:hypothetical protein